MTTSITFTFIATDKPGLIEKLSNTVSEHGGNWLESRMSQLGGYFTGITRVQISSAQRQSLITALESLSSNDIDITIQADKADDKTAKYKQLTLNLLGIDRPGILRELTGALTALDINVCEMNTNISSAAMSAEPLFAATAQIQVPESVDLKLLTEKLDHVANELTVDINLDE